MSEQQVKKLNDFRHTRLRTEILFGSREIETKRVPIFTGETLVIREVTWVPALFTVWREIFDNSADEVIKHGHGDRIDVTFDTANMIFTVADNGRGIPIHHDEELGGIVASVALSEARTGRNFEARGDAAGMNGVGASGVNFTSEFFDLEVRRDKKVFTQSWQEGPEETHLTDGPVIKAVRGQKETGTTVRFTPSRKIYPNIVLPDELVRSHCWMVAVLNPNVKVTYNGVHLKPKAGDDAVMKTLFAGYKPFVLQTADDSLDSRFWVVPNFTEGEEAVYGLVNLIPSWSGMDHVDVFRNLFYGAVADALEPKAKKEKLTITRADMAQGVFVFNTTRVKEATFDSQNKSRLTKSTVNAAIKDKFNQDEVKRLLKQNPEWSEQILARARERQAVKDQKDIDKAQKANKRTKVAGLMPANGLDRMKCILFLTEGESAISELSSVRNPDIHGGLGLRGKILNVYDIPVKKVVEDPVCNGIMNAIGLQIGKKAVRRELKYGHVYLATDEDVDGKNITALLVNFFYKFWPELFDAEDKNGPFIQRFETPYIIAKKGKQVHYYYAHNEHEFESQLEKYRGWDVTRAKGLAALTKEDWKNALAQPQLVPYYEDGNLAKVLGLVFDTKRADDRKEWLAGRVVV